MATFPVMYHHGTLVHTPILESEEFAIDPAIRSPIEAGYVQSRAKFTNTKIRWAWRYEMLKNANKVTLRTFEIARLGGSEAFTWVNPISSVSYTVRFPGIITYVPVPFTNNTRWTVTFGLEQQ